MSLLIAGAVGVVLRDRVRALGLDWGPAGLSQHES